MCAAGALAKVSACALAFSLVGGAVAASDAHGATTVFNPTADALVESSAPTTNFGSATELRADASPTVNSYLRFDPQGLSGQVVRATLRVYARNTASKPLALRGVSDVNWGESTITHANAPPVGAGVASSGTIRDGHWVWIDATSLVAGPGAVSFALTTTSSSSMRVSSREIAAEAPQLLVQTAAPGDVVAAAAGDIACDPASSSYNGGLGTATSCRQLFTSDLLLSPSIGAVLPLGDIQYERAKLTAFQQSYDPTWGRVRSFTHPVPGNHEYQTSGASGYFDYFNGVGNATGPAGQRATGYYSYELGAWHVIALNSNCLVIRGCEVGSPQQQWLQADLAAHPSSCVLAYWHHPRFSSGSRHGSDPTTSALWNTLSAAGADVVLSGHEHLYERFSRQTSAGRPDPAGGIREFVVGTGGKSHYSISSVSRNSGARDTKTFGVLELILRPGGYDWSFVPEEGWSFTDAGSDVCVGTTVDSEPPGKPGGLEATFAAGAVALRWLGSTDNDGVAGYRILRDGKQIATSTTASYSDAGVQSGGHQYDYRVIAYDSLGNTSPASNPVTMTTPGGLSFSPSHDGSIYASSPGTGFGSAPTLEVDGSPRKDFLVKFDVSGVGSGSVASATLRFHNTNTSPFGGELHPVVDDSWQEGTLTWGNAPAAEPSVIGNFGPVSPGNWYTVDVSSQVTGDGVYSFRMVSPNSDGADYHSKQGTPGLAPELVIALGSS